MTLQVQEHRMFPIFPRAVQKWPREPAAWKGIRKDLEITTRPKFILANADVGTRH